MSEARPLGRATRLGYFVSTAVPLASVRSPTVREGNPALAHAELLTLLLAMRGTSPTVREGGLSVPPASAGGLIG